MRQFIATVPDAMVVVDRDGLVQCANERANEMFGARTLEGVLVEALLPERLAAVHQQHREGFFVAPRFRPMGMGIALVGRRLDGSEFPVDISLGHVELDGVVYVSAAMRDATKRRAELAALQIADRVKDDYLATVSHELRTPLTVIIGFAKLMHGRIPSEFDPQLDAIVRNAHDMHSIVERLLDFSRLESGHAHIEPGRWKVDDLVADVLPLVEPRLEAHDFRTEVEPDIEVEVDPHGFGRILVNLLTNAAKFTEEGHLISLRVMREGDLCRIIVEDEGVGIAGDLLDRIFDRYYQIRGESGSKLRGAGIGLAIVKGYAEAMGGTVRVESEPGEGSRFIVEFPVVA